MKKYIEIIFLAILAGILIGIAGTLYLSYYQTNLLGAAVLFSFGLLIIVTLNYNLYTGKVGYLIDNKLSYFVDLLLIILGNLIGLAFMALIIHLSNKTNIIDNANIILNNKLSFNMWQSFLLSIPCGMLMYLGVDGYKRSENVVAKVLILVFAVTIFLVIGFEHSIANLYYLLLKNSWNFDQVLYFLLWIIGNGIGSVMLNYLEKKANLKE